MIRDIPLSDADYYFYRRERYTIQYIFRYAGRIDENRLRRGLLLTAAALPPVGARLVATRPKELSLRPGHAVPLREQMVPAGADPASLVDPVTNAGGLSLVKALLSRGPGGDSVGFSFSHLLGDGRSFFLFLQTLVAYLGGDPVPRADHSRERLRGGNHEGPPARTQLFSASGYVLPAPPASGAGAGERFLFSDEELDARKAMAEARGLRVNRNSLVMALLAKRFYRDIPLVDGNFLVRCPVDYRSRLGLPENYFGNAVLDAVAAFALADMRTKSVEAIAAGIGQAIREITPEKVARHLACLRSLREEHGLRIFEEIGCPGLLVSNLTKLPFSSIDLGAGAPTEVSPASVNPRLAVVLPGEGGADVRFRRPLKPLAHGSEGGRGEGAVIARSV